MKKVWTESEHYKIVSEYETVYLEFKGQGLKPVIIGDFYGDPESVMISEDEKYVAMGGCGLIIYFLQEPFIPYQYETVSPQFKEFYRYPPNDWWIQGIHQDAHASNCATFMFVGEDDDGLNVYRMNIETEDIESVSRKGIDQGS